MSSMVRTYFFPLLLIFLVHQINASIFLSSLLVFLSRSPFQSHPTVTRENLILSVPAKHVPSAQPASFKTKTPTQVFRAKCAREDTTVSLTVPRPALISAASNPLIARTTSTLTRPFVTASVVLVAPLVSVPLILHKSKQNLDGSSVPTILRNLRSVLFQVHALEDPTQHSMINSLMPRKMILLSVPTARKDVTTSTDTPTAPDFADSARLATAWMVSVESAKSVRL